MGTGSKLVDLTDGRLPKCLNWMAKKQKLQNQKMLLYSYTFLQFWVGFFKCF